MNQEQIIAFQNETLDRQTDFIESQHKYINRLSEQKEAVEHALKMAVDFIDLDPDEWDAKYGKKTENWILAARSAIGKLTRPEETEEFPDVIYIEKSS